MRPPFFVRSVVDRYFLMLSVPVYVNIIYIYIYIYICHLVTATAFSLLAWCDVIAQQCQCPKLTVALQQFAAAVNWRSVGARQEQQLIFYRGMRERETANCVAVLQSAAQLACALLRNVGFLNIEIYWISSKFSSVNPHKSQISSSIWHFIAERTSATAGTVCGADWKINVLQ
jgi:hypothetical protein